MKKKIIESNSIQKKKDDLDRRDMIHLIKQKLIVEKKQAIKRQAQQLKWLKILNLMVIADFIRRTFLGEIIQRKIKCKQLVVYRQVWDEWRSMVQARGASKLIRVSWDCLMTMKTLSIQKQKVIKAHSQRIVVDILSRTAWLIGWNSKLIEYREEGSMIKKKRILFYSIFF